MELNANNYFSAEMQKKYFSVSMFKSFMKCPAAALAELRGEYQREQTTSLLVGSFVDAYFSGELEQFKSEHPEIFKRDRTLKSEYMQALEIIKRVRRDPLFMEYMSGEKQVIMTGEICGVPVKIKADALHSDKIVDLKVMRDFMPIYSEEMSCKVPFWIAWGYDIQAAVYQEIVYQNTGKRLPFFLAAATKEKVTDYNIFHIVQSDIDLAMDTVKQNIQRFDAMKQGLIEPDRCGECEYCRETKVLSEIIESDSVLI
jgi:hypothetical protein